MNCEECGARLEDYGDEVETGNLYCPETERCACCEHPQHDVDLEKCKKCEQVFCVEDCIENHECEFYYECEENGEDALDNG
jgi:hypothetical protein